MRECYKDHISSDVICISKAQRGNEKKKVVILAGGYGTRISEEFQFKPMPMIEIGGQPILWYIMKDYSYDGFNDFVICAGYKQNVIKEWFANYFLNNSDVQLDYSAGQKSMTVLEQRCEPWRVTVADTDTDTMIGGRLKRIQKYVKNETFMLTYAEGVCDVDIQKLLAFHKAHGKIATLTAVLLEQQKGILDIGGDKCSKGFPRKEHVRQRTNQRRMYGAGTVGCGIQNFLLV